MLIALLLPTTERWKPELSLSTTGIKLEPPAHMGKHMSEWFGGCKNSILLEPLVTQFCSWLVWKVNVFLYFEDISGGLVWFFLFNKCRSDPYDEIAFLLIKLSTLGHIFVISAIQITYLLTRFTFPKGRVIVDKGENWVIFNVIGTLPVISEE